MNNYLRLTVSRIDDNNEKEARNGQFKKHKSHVLSYLVWRNSPASVFKMVHFCLGHFQLLFPLILIFKIVTWSKYTNLSVVCSNLTRDLFENENLSFIENKIFNKHRAKVQLSGVFK